MLTLPALSTTVLCLEQSCLRVLVVQGGRVVTWETRQSTGPIFRDGVVLPTSELQEMVRDLFGGKVPPNLRLVVPAGKAMFRTFKLPKTKRAITEAAILREVRDDVGSLGANTEFFWDLYRSERTTEEAFVIGLPKEVLTEFADGLAALRLKVRRWELKPLTLARAVGREQVVIVDAEAATTEIVVVSGKVPRLVRTFSESQEEDLQRRGHRLAQHITQTLAYYAANTNDEAKADMTVVVTGTLGAAPGFAELLGSALNVPVEAYESPFAHGPDFPAASYAGAIGAALRASSKESAGFAAVQVDAGRYAGLQVAPSVLAAGLAIVVAGGLLFPVVHAQGNAAARVEAKQFELTQAQSKVREVRGEIQRRAEAQKAIDELVTRSQTMEQERAQILALGGGAVSERLFAARELLPAKVTLDRFYERERNVVIEGAAAGPADVFSYVAVLESSGQFGTAIVSALSERPENGDYSYRLALTVRSEASK